MTVDWTGIIWDPVKGYNLPVDDQQLELFIEPEKLGIDVDKKKVEQTRIKMLL